MPNQVNTINKPYRNVSGNLHNDNGDQVIVKGPNTIINDYTKNISDSMFTPGIYKQTDNLKKLSTSF